MPGFRRRTRTADRRYPGTAAMHARPERCIAPHGPGMQWPRPWSAIVGLTDQVSDDSFEDFVCLCLGLWQIVA